MKRPRQKGTSQIKSPHTGETLWGLQMGIQMNQIMKWVEYHSYSMYVRYKNTVFVAIPICTHPSYGPKQEPTLQNWSEFTTTNWETLLLNTRNLEVCTLSDPYMHRYKNHPCRFYSNRWKINIANTSVMPWKNLSLTLKHLGYLCQVIFMWATPLRCPSHS